MEIELKYNGLKKHGQLLFSNHILLCKFLLVRFYSFIKKGRIEIIHINSYIFKKVSNLVKKA